MSYYITEGTIGYMEIDSDETWDAALYHTPEERPVVINVDNVITTLEDKDEPLTPGETELLAICRAAEEKGIPDLSVY